MKASSASGRHRGIRRSRVSHGASIDLPVEGSTLEAFGPDVLILCASFDGHKHDPRAGLRLAPEDFRALTLRLSEHTARRCGGGIVSRLEGGYRLEDLAESVGAWMGA